MEKRETIHIVSSDPASVSLHGLYQQADIVALVTILSGDVEHYSDAVYKASVVRAFKGVRDHEVIYFGPFTSYAVGSEYVVALRRSPKHLRDLAAQASDSALPYDGEATYLQIMYEGYSVMAVEYTCLFPSCDWGVEISEDQVTLPKRLRRVRTRCHDGASSVVWVKKDEFLSELAHQGAEGNE